VRGQYINIILKLRYHQLVRLLNNLGRLRSFLFLLFLLIPIVIQPGLLYELPILVIPILHYSRKDNRFLQLIGIKPFIIFSIEYLVICIPGLVAGLLTGTWWAIVLIPGAFITAFLPSNFKINSNRSLLFSHYNPLPITAYEWRSVFRRTKYFYYFLYLILLIAAILYPNTLPISLVIVGYFQVSFFDKCESFQFLEAFQRGPDRFLWYKIGHGLFYYSISMIPYMAIYFLEPAFPLYVPLIIYAGGLLWVVNCVVTKYMLYMEGKDLKYSYAYIMLIVLFSFVFPIIPVLTASWFYWRARNRLKYYLYAFD